MTYFIVSMIILGLSVSLYRRRRFMRTQRLHQSFINIQCTALIANDTKQVVKDAPFETAQSFELESGFCCAYWIEQKRGVLTHKIAGRMRDDGADKKLIQNMLALMSELTVEFNASDIQDKIKFKVAKLDEQTHLVHFTLSKTQHDALMAHATEIQKQLT